MEENTHKKTKKERECGIFARRKEIVFIIW